MWQSSCATHQCEINTTMARHLAHAMMTTLYYVRTHCYEVKEQSCYFSFSTRATFVQIRPCLCSNTHAHSHIANRHALASRTDRTTCHMQTVSPYSMHMNHVVHVSAQAQAAAPAAVHVNAQALAAPRPPLATILSSSACGSPPCLCTENWS